MRSQIQENSSSEEDETNEEGGLEVSPWDLFSQAVEPEEEEIELVIIDEVEQETESPISNPEVTTEFDEHTLAPMDRQQGMVEQKSQEDTTEEPINLNQVKTYNSRDTSTFTLEDIEGDGFALNLEEIEASERSKTQERTTNTETTYEAFDLSLSEVPNLGNVADKKKLIIV